MNTDEKSIKKSSTTDWIQSICAIIGTLFAIVGLFIAWESLNKKDLDLQNQIKELRDITKENAKLLQRQIDLKIAEIKPIITIRFGEHDETHIQAFFLNSGKSVRIKKIIFNKRNNLKLKTKLEVIEEGKENEIYFEILNQENPILDITIFYIDIDGKEDSKRFQIEGTENIFGPTPTITRA